MDEKTPLSQAHDVAQWGPLTMAQKPRRYCYGIVGGLGTLSAENDAFPVAGKVVTVLDPTEILARKCVSLCQPAAV